MQFTEEQKAQVAEIALEKIRQGNLSVSKLSKEAGVNAGEMSFVVGLDNEKQYFIKNAWNDREVKGNKQPLSDRFWLNLADYVGYKVRPTFWKEFDFLNTQIVMKKLQEVKEESKTAWIQAHVGMSKTHGVNKFKKLNPYNTYVVKGIRCSPRAFAVRIAQSVGLKHINGNSYNIIDDVIRTLRSQVDKQPIIIFEEAENQALTGWEMIKYMFDELEGQVSIVVVAANNVIDVFEKKYKLEKAVFSQIYSRFNNVVNLFPVQLDEVQMVCNELGIANKALQKRIFDYSTDYRILKDTVGDLLKAHHEGKIQLTIQDFDSLYN